MLGTKQSRDHVTNERLYHRVNHVPIREMIRELQFKFTGHCIRMPNYEHINCFVLLESTVRPSLLSGAPTRAYRQQISSQILTGEKALEATEIWKIAVN